MYVGDKLDEDMILAWAKTENPDDTIDGFKVTNGEIKVKLADNTLVETGNMRLSSTRLPQKVKQVQKRSL